MYFRHKFKWTTLETILNQMKPTWNSILGMSKKQFELVGDILPIKTRKTPYVTYCTLKKKHYFRTTQIAQCSLLRNIFQSAEMLLVKNKTKG